MNNSPLHGEIYWADLEPVKGSEQHGQRPVFIASNNLMNKFSPVVLVSPMTRKDKVYDPFEIPYRKEDLNVIHRNIKKLEQMGYNFDNEFDSAVILCQQSRSISKQRLIMKIGNFKSDIYSKKVKNAISFLYAINGCMKCHEPMRVNSLRCRNCGEVHNRKCPNCRKVFNCNYNFCPYCGKGGWLK